MAHISPKTVPIRAQQIFEREKPRDRRTVHMLSEAERQRYFEQAIKELEAEGTKRSDRS
jgi:hypothetical protein